MKKPDINTLTEEQKELLNQGYNIFINDDGKLVTEKPQIESEEFLVNEKNKMISDYRNIQKEIVKVKGELQEIEDTYDTYNETGKYVADKQKTILSGNLSTLREQKDNLVLEGISKYGEGVLNEL